MTQLDQLFDNNRRWAHSIKDSDPQFFEKLAAQQSPEYLWIGCSDSRVPANQIVGLMPGEVFVHRNVANVVVHTDFICLTVLQYENADNGLIDNWLRNIKDVQFQYAESLQDYATDDERINRLCELNVIRQVANVSYTTIAQNAWARGQALSVHGLVYGLEDGLLKDLDCTVSSGEQLHDAYRVEPG